MRAFSAFRRIGFAGALAFLAAMSPATAQNVSGVSGADVKAGEDAIEYRAGFATADDGRPGLFAHRFHYQHAFDGAWRVRFVVLQGENATEGLKTRAVRIEVLRQFLESEDTGGWDSAIRIDGVIPTEERPGRAGIAWLNGFELGERWQARANLYLGKEIGDLERDGVIVETREEATYEVSSALRFGAQMFNGFNTTAQFGTFHEQRHQIGPIAKIRLTKNLKLDAGALFGVSHAASDADFRLFFTYEI